MTTQHTPGPWHVEDDNVCEAKNNDAICMSYSCANPNEETANRLGQTLLQSKMTDTTTT